MTRLLLLVSTVLTLSACGDIEDTKEYQAGYDDGQAAGYDDGYDDGKDRARRQLCDEIESRLNDGAASAVGC